MSIISLVEDALFQWSEIHQRHVVYFTWVCKYCPDKTLPVQLSRWFARPKPEPRDIQDQETESNKKFALAASRQYTCIGCHVIRGLP